MELNGNKTKPIMLKNHILRVWPKKRGNDNMRRSCFVRLQDGANNLFSVQWGIFSVFLRDVNT